MIQPSHQSELIEPAEKTGLAHHNDYLLAEARECVYYFCDESLPADRIGCSRIGGLPDLPEQIPWPSGFDEGGKPRGYADFLAQFNFAEIPAADGMPLPRQGYLWVFVLDNLILTKLAVVYGASPE